MAEIFLIESISWILILLLEVPWGWFADRFGYKRTLVIANFVFFISKIVFFAAASFPMFLFERVLLSVALSGLSGCDITLLFLSKAPETSSERMFARYRWCATSGPAGRFPALPADPADLDGGHILSDDDTLWSGVYRSILTR